MNKAEINNILEGYNHMMATYCDEEIAKYKKACYALGLKDDVIQCIGSDECKIIGIVGWADLENKGIWHEHDTCFGAVWGSDNGKWYYQYEGKYIVAESFPEEPCYDY